MKASGIAQGFKSLADKIHHQLPLTTKESSRLLTALTSSFRRHLDEVHPTLPVEDKKDGGKHGASRASSNAIHTSAAAHAQNHMASVLTSPLMVRGAPRLDYGSAKVDLARDSVDPMQLLEEYAAKGVATVEIAALVLNAVRKEHDSLPNADREKYLADMKPGQRTMLWLLKSKLIETALFTENVLFMDSLAVLMIREGREETLWQLLQLDLSEPLPKGGLSAPRMDSRQKEMLHRYRWRGRLLRAMVHAKTGLSDLTLKSAETLDPECLHAALDTFFRACEMKQTAMNGRAATTRDSPAVKSHLSWLPLGAPGSYLHTLLTRRIAASHSNGKIKLDFAKVDCVRYERFIDYVRLYTEGVATVWIEVDEATLEMCHPRRPTANRMLRVIRQLTTDGDVRTRQRFRDNLITDSKRRRRWSAKYEQCIAILQSQGRSEDAAWMTQILLDLDPAASSRLAATPRSRVGSQTESSMEPGRVPFPSFA